MPLLGLGTYMLLSPEDVYLAVDAALAGYRPLTVQLSTRMKPNWAALKELLPKHGLTREDVFITSKLDPKDQGERAMEGALHSLSQLDLGYIDLYLIHEPGTEGLVVTDQRNPGNRAQSWAHIGGVACPGEAKGHRSVQLHTSTHERTAAELQNPSCIATEFHPRLCQTELRSVCDEYGVCFQAFSSLGKGDLVTNPVVMEVAKNCKRTPAQVLLRWAVQQGVPVIPKSSNPDRMKDNAKIFDFTLSDTDMDRRQIRLGFIKSGLIDH
ncbi:Aldose reductase B [Larimichthys crocea]|uniref:Aldose reductase B n=1 Tax=Larimichthys crocea TaxID=215358 RepID=A0A6G0HCN8_LARCR|nr:Aldose reductase B [Larimichthys crocea]